MVGREQEIALLGERWQQARDHGEGRSRSSPASLASASRASSSPSRNGSPASATGAPLPVPAVLPQQRAAGRDRRNRADRRAAARRHRRREARPARPASRRARLGGPRCYRPSPSCCRSRRASAAGAAAVAGAPQDPALGALLARIEALAARDPLLVVFEDVHWIDPTSRAPRAPRRPRARAPPPGGDHPTARRPAAPLRPGERHRAQAEPARPAAGGDDGRAA